MKKFTGLLFANLVVLVLLGLVGCSSIKPGADGIGDAYYPQLGNGGYDALHYTLELSIDPIGNTLSGNCTIEARATQSLSAFNLDFSGLTIEQVTVNGQAAEYQRKESELTITPAEPLNDGDTFTVSVTYSGTPQASPALGGPWKTGWQHTDNNQVFVSSEPSGAATWYPVNDHPLDKATYTFRITVPKPYVVAANGLLQQELDNGDTITDVWEATEPMASYLAAVNIDKYVVETMSDPDGILIRNYLTPDLPEYARTGINKTTEMLSYFSELFGPYPFKAYGIVIVDFPEEESGFAMETQTLSQHELDEHVFSLSDEVVAHELAHQWFGDSVSLESWQDIWLNEGAATYAEWLWTEYKVSGSLDTIVRSQYPQYTVSPDPAGKPLPTDLYSNTVYGRGALTFHALRLRVGDEAFFQILRTYTDRFRYGNASTADFIAVAEEVSGQDLGDFFNAWLYDTKNPPIPEIGLE